MVRRRSRAAVSSAVLGLAAVVAAACGGESTVGEGGTEAGGGGAVATAGPGAADTAAAGNADAAIDTEASFIYAYPITVSRLDPHRASISQDATTLFPAYDRLVHLSPEAELIPGLAESWEFSPDGLQLTMTLREGVTFHDGAAFDAEAVKKNLERAKGIQGSSVATDLAALETVTVVDPTTVQLTLSRPNVALVGSLADRAGIQVSPTAIDSGVNLDEEMVGAGAFKMVSHTPGASTVFERYDGYWDTENVAKVKGLEIRVIADPVARLNALRTGQIQATTVNANQISEVEGDASVELILNTELQYFYVVQNRSRASQDQLTVRQAMLHALDREGMCQALLFGYCELTDQPFPPGYFAYNEDIPAVLYPYDQEKAKQLLAEAGVTSLDVSLLIPAGLPTYPEMAEAIQAQWKDVGINATIQAAEPTQLGELMFAQKTADTMLATWGGRPDPSMTFAQRASAAGFANPGGVTTPKMEALLAQSVAATDETERGTILRDGSREMAESVLEMVVLFPQVPYVTQTNVMFEPYLSSKPEFRSVAITV